MQIYLLCQSMRNVVAHSGNAASRTSSSRTKPLTILPAAARTSPTNINLPAMQNQPLPFFFFRPKVLFFPVIVHSYQLPSPRRVLLVVFFFFFSKVKGGFCRFGSNLVSLVTSGSGFFGFFFLWRFWRFSDLGRLGGKSGERWRFGEIFVNL